MTDLRFFIDTEKVEEKKAAWMKPDIFPCMPVIKTGGLLGDAGIDFAAAYSFVVLPQSFFIAETFVGVVLPVGVAGLLYPRSGDDFVLGAGVIDTGYLGTVKFKIVNPYGHTMVFNVGDSVGQMVLFKKAFVETPNLLRIEKSEIGITSERGESGRIVNQFDLR